jgi:hypothetical protein
MAYLPDHRAVDTGDIRPARQHHRHLKFTLEIACDGGFDSWDIVLAGWQDAGSSQRTDGYKDLSSCEGYEKPRV